MAKQTINLGTPPTGVGGDTSRSGTEKLQANDDELYTFLGATDGTLTAEKAKAAIGLGVITGGQFVGNWPSSFVVDASGKTQQEINNGLETISDMLAITNPQNGSRVFVKGYHVPDLFIEANPYKGGGNFVWDATSTATVNNGTVFAVDGIATGRWVRVDVHEINVEMFGTKGDGSYDDRPAFQSAIDYLHSVGGGELIVPKPPVGYRWKSYDAIDSACLVIPVPTRGIYVDPISIRGLANLTDIKVDLGAGVTIEAAILLKGGGLYKKFENLSVWGGINSTAPNCNYVLKGSDAYYPNMTVRDCRFYVAKKDCLRLATYVTVFDKLQTAYSQRGIVVDKPDGMGSAPCTSITLNSCYALNHTHNGYWFGETTYCTFNSCAADHIINTTADGYEAYPYYIDIARGVAINGCGAEASTRILKVRVAQGLTINGIMTLSIGDDANPPTNLIRIDGGYSTTIAGIWNHNSKGFQYKLSLGNLFSGESVTVLDQSLEPKDVSYLSNYRFARPIRFVLDDFSKKTQDITLTNTGDPTTNTTNLVNAVELAYDTNLIYDVIIRFPSGDYEINSAVYLTNTLTRGIGRLRLIGNADGTSRLVVNASGVLSFGRPAMLSRLNYTVENLNLYTLNGGTRGILFYKADVIFINSKISSDNGYKQWAGDGQSSITLDANSAILTSMYSPLEVKFSYKAATAPTTSNFLPIGTVFNASDANATRIGWVNTTDNNRVWTPITISEPSGTTAQRPTGVSAGFQYFDTTLGKPIFWKGSVWVDAAGTTVA